MPTIIDELAMTLHLDPTQFEEGMEKAKAAEDSFLERVIKTLQLIEQKTTETATNTAHIQEKSAETAKETAERAGEAQSDAARKSSHEQEEHAKNAATTHRKVASEMEEAYGKTAGAVKRVAVELLGLFGISMSVSAIERLFSGILRTNESAANLARSISGDVESLTAWENMAGRLGGTAEGTANALATLSREAQQWHYTGRSNLPSQARELFGANIIDDKGEMLKGQELILALADAADRKGMTGAQRQYAAREMGIEGAAPAIQSGGAQIREQIEIQKRSGNFTTEQDAKDAWALGASLDKVYNSGMGLARMFWRDLGPAIKGIVDRIEAWIEKNRDWLNEKAAEWGKRLGNALVALAEDFDKLINGGAGKFATTIGEVAHVADVAAHAVGGWTVVLETFAALWIGSKIMGTIAAIGRMTAAITGLTATSTGMTGFLKVFNALTMALGAINKANEPDFGSPETLPIDSPLWRGVPKNVQEMYPYSPERQANPRPDDIARPSMLTDPGAHFAWGNPWLQKSLGYDIPQPDARAFLPGGPSAPIPGREPAAPATPGTPAPATTPAPSARSEWGLPETPAPAAPAPATPAPARHSLLETISPIGTAQAAEGGAGAIASEQAAIDARTPSGTSPEAPATPALPTPISTQGEAPAPTRDGAEPTFGGPATPGPEGGDEAEKAATGRTRASWAPSWMPEFLAGPKQAATVSDNAPATARGPTGAGSAESAAMSARWTTPWGGGTAIGAASGPGLPAIGTPAKDVPGDPSSGGGGGASGGGGGGGGTGGGAGDAPTVGEPLKARGTLQANQAEAYNAAISAGLSDSSARALVANMSGESLNNPGIVNKDYNSRGEFAHMARGIVQWDPARSEAIKAQFGKYPNELSVADQTRAAIWEMKKSYPTTWAALQGNGSTESKVATLVTNYERPADSARSTAERLRHLKGLPTQFAPPPTAQAGQQPGATPMMPPPGSARPSLPRASDEARATLAQAAPPSPELSFGGRGDSWGGTRTLTPVGASAMAQTFNGGSSSVDRSQSSQTTIGDLHVHTAATDASGIAKSIKSELRKYDYVAQSDTGLA